MTLGEHIQALRKGAGLSQEALGEELGVTRQSISKWESDQAAPELEKLIAMRKRFDVSLESLLQLEEHSPAALSVPQLNAQLCGVVAAVVDDGETRRRQHLFMLSALFLPMGFAAAPNQLFVCQ